MEMNRRRTLKRQKRRGHFWQNWQDAHRTEDREHRATFDHRTHGSAWHTFLAEFLGVPPEKHWLFGGRRFKSWISGKWGPPSLFNPFVAVMLTKGGGLLSLFVLHLLAEKPRYGNDIMREIEDRTKGRWGANPGAIYPLLTAMEERGLVEGAWEDPQKRTRRVYSLTPAGSQELERLKEVMRPKLEEAINVLRGMYDDLSID
jgi:DNA-binding PadR family transcriptional regulator